jgi:hypothetical protein
MAQIPELNSGTMIALNHALGRGIDGAMASVDGDVVPVDVGRWPIVSD